MGNESAVDELPVWIDDIELIEGSWEAASVANTVSDAVVRSQSGRILQNTLIDSESAAPEVSTYSYDAAGRLIEAVIPHHELTLR